MDISFAEEEFEFYKIGVGDILTINVWGNPELTSQVPVRPDGYISIPLVGDISASGFDAASLTTTIAELLQEQLRNPQVTVIVSQVNSREYISRVRITGAVQSPRSIPYARGMSVLDAILEAGGVNDVASANRAKLYRQVDGQLLNFDIKLDDILLRGLLETNYPMRAGDVITVPERLF
ncbi:MAG: sugar ABC transporter substrate-binding protein [SAR86 cluster bacterium]|uniref:Sugar ABC transporter substrate-binding protein n=1 Tax=SAR86 cluster bacterium TaxID=2030880 RepID=A0A2A5B840_9GAMM|nr:MAG: sugar ABC transporter substrate-binding protein [SAR86 cluster bacterium]